MKRAALFTLFLGTLAIRADYRAPAGASPVLHGANGAAILPGGRFIKPYGIQFPTGPGPANIAVSPSGRFVAVASVGPERASITILDQDKKGAWSLHHLFTSEPHGDLSDSPGVSGGIAWDGEKNLWFSEGASGKVRLIEAATGSRKRELDLNFGGITQSYSGALAFNPESGVLYVADLAHSRLTAFDTRNTTVPRAVPVGYVPIALALSTDRKQIAVACTGILDYHTLKESIPFPGNDRADPASDRSSVVDLVDAASLNVVHTAHLPSPSALLALGADFYITSAIEDTVRVVDASGSVKRQFQLEVPAFEQVRGLIPSGLATDAEGKELYVALGGVNAVAVVDLNQGTVRGLMPTGWYPTGLAFRRGELLVANLRGRGTGPSSIFFAADFAEFPGLLRRGTVSAMPIPDPAEFPALTRRVLAANGLLPQTPAANANHPEIKHVVIIVGERGAFDEYLGDVKSAANGPVAGEPRLARLSDDGYVDGRRERFSLQHISVTPNLHALAARFAFSDNFYSTEDEPGFGHRRLQGALGLPWLEILGRSEAASWMGARVPNPIFLTPQSPAIIPEEEPINGSLWARLQSAGITFRSYGEGLAVPGAISTGAKSARVTSNAPLDNALFQNAARDYPLDDEDIPDQDRASRFIADLDKSPDLPQLLFIHLAHDGAALVDPKRGYPFRESNVADSDLALGRIVEHLSHSRWWSDTVVFYTKAAASGRDHVDASRTVLLAAGPSVKSNYCSHINANLSSLLKTALDLLHLPSMNLASAAASNLYDLFTAQPDPRPFDAVTPDTQLFDPKSAQ